MSEELWWVSTCWTRETPYLLLLQTPFGPFSIWEWYCLPCYYSCPFREPPCCPWLVSQRQELLGQTSNPNLRLRHHHHQRRSYRLVDYGRRGEEITSERQWRIILRASFLFFLYCLLTQQSFVTVWCLPNAIHAGDARARTRCPGS